MSGFKCAADDEGENSGLRGIEAQIRKNAARGGNVERKNS